MTQLPLRFPLKQQFTMSRFYIGKNYDLKLIELEASGICNEEMKESQVQNLAAYFVTLPSEVAMKLWTVVGAGDNSNVILLHKTQVDGQPVSSHLVELMTGSTAE